MRTALYGVVMLVTATVVSSSALTRARSRDYTLIVTYDSAGTGSGSITAGPPGLCQQPKSGTSCACQGGTCEGTYPEDTGVTLTAIPDFGSVFVGWTDGCKNAASPRCMLLMSTNKTVTVRFDRAP
jgi:hypothetical protein